jgi:predicted RNA-binding Zn ribbon-like protein
VEWLDRVLQKCPSSWWSWWWVAFMAASCCNAFVQLNPYGHDAVVLAVDLVNARPENGAELVERCEAAGVVFEDGTSAPDLAEVLDYLDRWCEVVDAEEPERRAELLNVLLAESTAHPRLTAHTGSWHLHYRDTVIPFARKLRALISSGTALHLAGRGMHRLGRCAADGCERVYADTSRNGRQRYCSPACANRDAVRRHRAARRAA